MTSLLEMQLTQIRLDELQYVKNDHYGKNDLKLMELIKLRCHPKRKSKIMIVYSHLWNMSSGHDRC